MHWCNTPKNSFFSTQGTSTAYRKKFYERKIEDATFFLVIDKQIDIQDLFLQHFWLLMFHIHYHDKLLTIIPLFDVIK